MQSIRYAICDCGRPMSITAQSCTTCTHATAKHRSSRPSSSSGERSTFTPPPTTTTSSPSRRSLDRPAPLSSSGTNSRTSSATEALTSAFSSESPVTGLFPSSIYRLPIRAASNSPIRRPSDSSSVSSSSRPSLSSSSSTTSSDSRRTSRSATPDYAPMSAGFARLGRHLQKRPGDSSASPEQQQQRSGKESTRSSLDLEARMFSGPA